ncbi:AMP-binding protein [Saxibacter everestensis]|uniref:AMP-binding protein n=1 Tax=Saxibacter everestensis TaxID=2909229 RepID=A0ABY8QXC8_9MICO|nr:AMP-binding protein [Brevibacteriaceae bacterium ZFBP1038]
MAEPMTYQQAYQESIGDPEGFWMRAGRDIRWIRKPTRALDSSNPPFYQWFPDGTLNVSYNALDRHVIEGRGEQAALIYDSPVTNSKVSYSYIELLDRVAKCAGVLRVFGVERGDRVVIYMPMIPEAVITMLACARLGAIHSVVFGGFAAGEIASRIDDAKPKVVVAASAGIEPSRIVEYKPMISAALERAEHSPAALLVFQRPQAVAELGENEYDLERLMRDGSIQPAEAVEVAATDPLYVLYTSGTTGKPKGIVRACSSAVALRWSLPNLYDVGAGDVMFTASDVGWVVGHSYIVYGPLLAGATTVLYEGKPVGTPDAGAFWRIVAEHNVKALFTAPTAIRAIKKEDFDGERLAEHDISSLETLFLAGERLDPDTFEWAGRLLGVPVVDNWWQTETGWPIASSPRGLETLPLKPGSPSVAVPGYDVRALDAEGRQLPPEVEGELVIKLPLPPGTLSTVWGDDARYVDGYLSTFDGYYLTGDGGYIDEDGYIFVMGRTDDVISVAGHRLSTGSLEAVLSAHADVAECAVIGVADRLKGQLPRGLVVLKAGIPSSENPRICSELVDLVRAEIGPVAALSRIDVVAALPKTRSGKILRKTMRQIAEGTQPLVPGTIEDAGVLDALTPVLRGDPA